MNTTELTKPPPARAGDQGGARSNPRSPDFELPSVAERLGAILPLIFVVPVAGPPAILLVGPLVLFALMLTGPFLLLLTFVLAAVVLLALTAAILVPSYLLVRHLGKHTTHLHHRHAPVRRRSEPHPVGVGLLVNPSDARLLSGSPAQPAAAALLRDPGRG